MLQLHVPFSMWFFFQKLNDFGLITIRTVPISSIVITFTATFFVCIKTINVLKHLVFIARLQVCMHSINILS